MRAAQRHNAPDRVRAGDACGVDQETVRLPEVTIPAVPGPIA
jgi:hypothetical protein